MKVKIKSEKVKCIRIRGSRFHVKLLHWYVNLLNRKPTRWVILGRWSIEVLIINLFNDQFNKNISDVLKQIDELKKSWSLTSPVVPEDLARKGYVDSQQGSSKVTVIIHGTGSELELPINVQNRESRSYIDCLSEQELIANNLLEKEVVRKSKLEKEWDGEEMLFDESIPKEECVAIAKSIKEGRAKIWGQKSTKLLEKEKVMQKKEYIFDGVVKNIVDGDTCDVMIDVGFRQYSKIRVVMVGPKKAAYDAPEIFKPSNDIEKKHGLDAYDRAEALLLEKEVLLITYPGTRHNEWLADIVLPDGSHYTEVMIKEGFQKKIEYSKS